MSEQPSQEDPFYRTYVEHRNKLYELHVDQVRSLDKSLLTLSGSAIGISIIFLEKFANPFDMSNWWILYCSWIALVTSIIFTMISFLASSKAILGQINLLDQHYQSSGEKEEREKWYSLVTRGLGLAAIGAFLFGIAGLLCFSALEFSSKERVDERKTEHIGAGSRNQGPVASDSASAPAINAGD